MAIKLYQCDCGAKGLTLDVDYEVIGCVKRKYIHLAIWLHGWSGNVMCLTERIRWCWHILTTGKPWADSICLDESTARQLSFDLLDATQEPIKSTTFDQDISKHVKNND